MTLAIVTPAPGTLRVAAQPRGISITVSVVKAGGVPALAASPVDRLGLVTVATEASAGDAIRVRVASRDSQAIHGEVCIDAEMPARADVKRVRAERAFGAAGQATARRDWQAAFASYEEAASAFAGLGLQSRAAAALHAMGELAYMRLQRERDAARFAQEALAAHGTSAGPVLRGSLLALRARALIEVSDPDAVNEQAEVRHLIAEARRLFDASAAGAREAARLTILEGLLAFRGGAPDEAQRLFLIARDACDALEDWECHASTAQNLAFIAESRESFSVALATYEHALELLDPAIAPELAAHILDNVGRLQRMSGLVRQSEASHREALRIHAGLRNCGGVRGALALLGALHVQVGSLEDAIDELDLAATAACPALLERSEARFASAAVRRTTSSACAQAVPPDALTADEKRAVLQALLALKDALSLARDLDGAQRCAVLAERYVASSRGLVRASNARGEVLLDRGAIPQARAAFEAARHAADEAGLAAADPQRGRTLLGLAQASLAGGEVRGAESLVLEALAASSARADIVHVITSLRALAQAMRASGRQSLAAQTLLVAMELTEQVPVDALDADVRASYLATQHAVFAELTDFLAVDARDEASVWRAFTIAERGRARGLRHALDQDGKPTDADGHRDLMRRIADLPVEADGAAGLVRRLDELTPGAAERLGSAERRALQSRLAQLGATLVQYASGARDLYAFVVDADRIRIVHLGERDSVAHAAERLVDALRDAEPSGAAITAAAQALAQRALWPVTGFIARERVLLAPDDALHFVPFAVLPWSADPASGLMVERAELAVVPSADFVTRLARQRPSTVDRFTLLGDPVFRRAQWQRQCNEGSAPPIARARGAADQWTEYLQSLPASRLEVQGIAALASEVRPGVQVETLLGCEATADALRRAAGGTGALMHLATHGRVDARRPRLSALAVTLEDGRATLGLLDILALDIHAKLVTLSACDTSRGRVLPGEGVVGPAQAFIEAGAGSVVATYWRVEDETTERFMRDFYGYLLKARLPLAAALRRAQLETAARSRSYGWAAFGLYGRPDARL
jgi:CHAT domain-containing protein/tetratricopeptide (TPR) repeat protein